MPKGLKFASFSSSEMKSSVLQVNPAGMTSLIFPSTSSGWKESTNRFGKKKKQQQKENQIDKSTTYSRKTWDKLDLEAFVFCSGEKRPIRQLKLSAEQRPRCRYPPPATEKTT